MAVIHWIDRRERFNLIALLALCGAAWGLAELTDEVREGWTAGAARALLSHQAAA